MLAKFREKRDGVQARAIVVQLALELAKLARENEVPIAARTAVVSPMRNYRIVAKDGVERHVRFFLKAKMFHPGVDLFLPGRVPRHFASVGVRFVFPAIGPYAHFGCQVIRLRVPPIATPSRPPLKENVSIHLTES